jgi:hypothetical protein
MTRRSLLCSLFIIAGIEIDPALGRQVLRADSACNRNQESFRLKQSRQRANVGRRVAISLIALCSAS